MIGYRIMKRRRAVSLDIARQFLDLPVANVSDCMHRMVAGGARLRPYYTGGRMAGPALTGVRPSSAAGRSGPQGSGQQAPPR